MASSNIINAVFGSGLCAVTTSAFRANYGMVLRFSGIDLPTAFEVDFSNYDVAGHDSITAIGQNGEVQIPDDLWDSGLNIYGYVYLHPTDDSGVTVYTVTIPVLGRPNRTEETPTPHEQTVIEQAISALNDAVEQTAADVASADASAQAAAQSEANASVSERAAAASASAALASQNAAESAAQSATESASGAAESARNAAQSAAQAAESATAAQASAEQAEQAKLDAQDAKEAAEAAQAAAEQAASSVSGLSAQIAQNTSDIADLVQSKAGALIDTASGSIASFVPDSTIPTVKGLTVNVEPVQDLHGYDHPWPAGGNLNLLDFSKVTVGGTHYGMTFSKGTAEGTIVISGTLSVSSGAVAPIQYADTSLSGKGYVFLTEHISGDSVIELNRTYGFRTESERAIAVYLTGEAGQSYTETIRISVYATTQTSWTPYSNICPISGWDEVEVQRTGINLFDYRTVRTATTNGVTLTNNNDGTLTLNGTATADAFFDLFNTQFGAEPLAERTYTLSGCPNGGGQNSYFLYIRPNYINDLGNGKTFTQAVIGGSLYVKQGQTLNNLIFRPQIELGSSVSDFKPYQGDTYTIQLGQTVYGGTLDVTSGVLTVDRASVTFDGTENWNVHGSIASWFYLDNEVQNAYLNASRADFAISSAYVQSNYSVGVHLTDGHFGIGSPNGTIVRLIVKNTTCTTVEEFKTLLASNPLQLCYELATPITVSLTPLEISVLTGQTNNIWADSGDVSVEYAADLKTYIDNKIAAAVAALS